MGEGWLDAPDRARSVALAKLAARYGVMCGGTDANATLEALRGRLETARIEGDTTLAGALQSGIADATTAGARTSEAT